MQYYCTCNLQQYTIDKNVLKLQQSIEADKTKRLLHMEMAEIQCFNDETMSNNGKHRKSVNHVMTWVFQTALF